MLQKSFHAQLNGIGIKIAYTEWGDTNKPVLMCVHGITRNSRDFDFLAQDLCDHYRVICPDIAGRGNSDNLSSVIDYHNITYAEIIKQLIGHLGVGKIDYIGTSMGGLIAIHFAHHYPHIIEKLVLNDIGFFIPKAPLKKTAKYVGIHPKFNNLKHAEDFLKVYINGFGITQPKHWEHVVQHSTKLNENNELVMNYDNKIAAAFGPDDHEQIEDLNVKHIWDKISFSKILLIRGEKSEILPLEIAIEMSKSKNNIELVEIKHVGHAPSLFEQNQIEIIKNWLLK